MVMRQKLTVNRSKSFRIRRGRLLAGIPRTSDGVNSRNALLDGRQGGERRMGFRLIPISDREEVIGAVIGVAMFDSCLQTLSKRDGRIEMKSVYGGAAAGKFRTFDRGSK